MKTKYSIPVLSGIFLQAVDQYYVTSKDNENTKEKKVKEMTSDEEITDKNFINNNFDFLNDSTDIETSIIEEERSRKNSGDFTLSYLKSSKSLTSTKSSFIELLKIKSRRLSAQMIDNFSQKIKKQKEEVYTYLKNYLNSSNYIQMNNLINLNGYLLSKSLHSSYGAQGPGMNGNANYFNYNYGNYSCFQRARCNSYPSNLDPDVDISKGNMDSSFNSLNSQGGSSAGSASNNSNPALNSYSLAHSSSGYLAFFNNYEIRDYKTDI